MLVKEFPKQFVIERFTAEKAKIEAFIIKLEQEYSEYEDLSWFRKLLVNAWTDVKLLGSIVHYRKKVKAYQAMLVDMQDNESDIVQIHLDDEMRKLLS